jgi:hypothetical protein
MYLAELVPVFVRDEGIKLQKLFENVQHMFSHKPLDSNMKFKQNSCTVSRVETQATRYIYCAC